MRIRVLSLPFDPESSTFDDAEVVALTAQHEILTVSDHFCVQQGAPLLVLVIGYREHGARRREVSRQPARAELDPAERILFERLRAWRNARAKRDGRPPYASFTNAQLEDVARARPQTKEALAALAGIGEARVRDYAEEVLAVVRGPDAG